MKDISILVYISLFAMLVSCNNKPGSETLVGSWTGKPESNCPDGFFSGGTQSATFNFSSEGKLKVIFTGSNQESTNEVTISNLNYAINGDSLILTSDTLEYVRMSYLIEFEGQEYLTLTRTYNSTINDKVIECSSVNKLKRDKSSQ